MSDLHVNNVGNEPTRSASAPEMRAIINEKTSTFQTLKAQVDQSKTKYEIDNGGNVTYTYYDKSGKELYKMTDVNGFGGNIYGYTDSEGNKTTLHDYEKDGIMNRMDYSKNGYPYFQAYDKNNDGKFDTGMPNTGKDTGKNIDLKN